MPTKNARTMKYAIFNHRFAHKPVKAIGPAATPAAHTKTRPTTATFRRVSWRLIYGALVSSAWPECHTTSYQEYCGQNQKQCGLLEPRDRRYGESHRQSEKADLQGQKIDSSKKGAER
jgi:hypothetical protein